MNLIKYTLCTGILMLLLSCNGAETEIGGSGLIETTETVVSAETSGRVLEGFFDEGSRVASSDTLAIIDPSRLELELVSVAASKEVIEAGLATAALNIEQAEIRQAYATTELERVNRLLKSGTGTERQLDQAEFEQNQSVIATRTARARVQTLQAELSRSEANINCLRRQLQDCYPMSPADGIVTEKYIEPGELLSPGKPIAKIARLDTVWVKVYLAASAFANVKIGDQATLSTESGGREFSGRVIWTSREAEFTPKNVQTEESRADLVYAVKVSVPNPDGSLKIGMPVFVRLD